jgi:hypothetical protein
VVLGRAGGPVEHEQPVSAVRAGTRRDHFAEDRLRAAVEADPALRVWTNRSVADTPARLDAMIGPWFFVSRSSVSASEARSSTPR